MIKELRNRVSQRNYLDKEISPEIIEEIKEVINNSPTSINGHSFSAIIIKDEKVKKKISSLNWNQQHIIDSPIFILFIGDLNRTNYAMNGIEIFDDVMKNELNNVAIVDASISASNLATYLLTKNIHHCFIGGVRSFPNELSKELNLNKYQFPVIGLSIGYPDMNDQNKIRPKLNKVYQERYNQEQLEEELKEYDDICAIDYALRSKNNKITSWSKEIEKSYKRQMNNNLYKDFYMNKIK